MNSLEIIYCNLFFITLCSCYILVGRTVDCREYQYLYIGYWFDFGSGDEILVHQKKIHHQLMAGMKSCAFSWPLIFPYWVFLIWDLHIHFCFSLGLFISKYVQKCIAGPWIISQSDIINMEYILFQHTIIASSHTITAFRIMYFWFLIRILLVDD